MSTVKKLVSFAATILLVVSVVCAQEQSVTTRRSTTTVTAAAAADRVRFTAPSTAVQIRLEIYGANGEKLFDNEIRGGNVVDWHLQNGQAERVSDGSYLCVITSKSLSGRISQKLGKITIENARASVQPTDTTQLTAQQTQAVGPLEENASLTVLKGDETQTATVIAHNGTDGQITRGKGALSFRIGDFFSGKDTEQMRLTAEGNLGIGITNPQARLDVDGVIRASQGIVFPDGTTQYSAASKTLGAKSTMPDEVSDQILGGKHKFHTESVTQNQIAKFLNGGGTLGDSVITETASGDIGIGAPVPGGVLDLQRNDPSDILQRFWNTGSGGAKLRYVAATGATSQLQLTDLQEWLMSIAGNNQIGMQFRVRDTSDANDEATLAARARMTILRNGYVGIGTMFPANKLHIHDGGITFTDPQGFANHNRFALNNSIAFASTGSLTLEARDDTNGSVLSLLTLQHTGNIGIGTFAPAYKLHVVGQDVRVEGSAPSIFPRFSLNFTGGNTDQKRWQNYASPSALNFTSLNDAETAETFWLQVNRGTGTAISGVVFPNGTVESKSGGFKFPDGSVQTTSANATFTMLRSSFVELPQAPPVSIAHLNLPAGTYLLTATIEFDNLVIGIQNHNRNVVCSFSGDQEYGSSIGGPGLFQTVTFHSVLVITSGGVDLSCHTEEPSPSSLFANIGRLTAVKIEGNVVVQ